ncbi:UPF0223 family protein [Pediococcus inopinatus]|jgi:uncharacterized protein YktA (UPF0223 family)|uniref:UPF0223 family protein n=1 Tax=Pediococcus inopinatus TaxID=114090 RepID=A0ABZ0Q221_9LACO|nr:UPF0223 family protein [Pediococcus inopinatus]AVL00097.1 hypothetical protein PI20285_05255 [Pediococcus inopinatus]KRN59673.1 hypothetical protein IV83_GL001695 [Pediococcus inopinatus]WPC17814.1 UPF0223 family protein [Pediococcus inopinatus]WPC19202.1 UPF0223 family protein [Pediococcus inopinatus]WPC20993.1 UPF0223 family protein [Pediococcus inopinatus]
MSENYAYPLEPEWQIEEITTVVTLYTAVETAYLNGIDRQLLLDQYHDFKKVVKSKSEEKQLTKKFLESSGFDIYVAIKTAQTSNKKRVGPLTNR